MPNSDFMDSLLTALRGQEDNTAPLECALPLPRYAYAADMVVRGEGATREAAARVRLHEPVEAADYIGMARCINLRFDADALFGAVAEWRSELPTPRCTVAPDREDESWDNPFYAVQYAHFRAGGVAQDMLHWDYGLAEARRLAVAVLLFPDRIREFRDAQGFMQELAGFARIYAEWHETLLAHRAAKIRQTNGELMQKEAIQYSVSSALLARAAAVTLQSGLHLLNIEPTKEWVE